MHHSDSAEASDRLLLGRQLSHYRVVERIGAGGMGVVYRARDERLQRDVAIKVLPAGALAATAVRLRLRREARALAKLSHTNIGAVFEFGEQDGLDFIVMEFVEGASLSSRLRAGPLAPGEILEIGVQLAAGLAAAHRAGVIHRDLKPANVQVSANGHVKILDFGVAKLLGSAEGEETQDPLTATAGVVGTPPYMAPEQILGRTVDARSDLWSLGAILYEMATGKRPFPVSPEAGLIDSILWSTPAPPGKRNAAIGPEIEAVVMRALQKEPAERYQTAQQLHDDLRRVSGTLPGPITARLSSSIRPRWPRLLLRVVLPVIVAVGAAMGIYLASSSATPLASVAVMPFQNDTRDAKMQYIADGMTEGIILRLSQLRRMKVIARSSVFRYQGKEIDPRQVGRELSVRAVLIGRLSLDQGRLTASTELVDTRDGRLLWGMRRVSETGSIGLQEEIARQLVQHLRPGLPSAARRRLTMLATRSEAAQKLYLRGLQQLYSSKQQAGRNALVLFQKAIQIDPLYALAHAGLASAYYTLSNLWLPPREAMPRARAAARRALELDPNLAQAHTLLATVQAVFDWNFPEAERSFRRAIELSPGYAPAHHFFGVLLSARARFEEAKRSFERARELDPLSMGIAITAIWPDLFRDRFDRVLKKGLRMAEVQPDFIATQGLLSRAYYGLGRYQEALDAARRSRALGGPTAYVAEEVNALVALGRTEEAHRKLAELSAIAAKTHVAAYTFAHINVYLGRIDEGFRYLSRAVSARDEDLITIAIDSRLRAIWKDPRFLAVLRSVRLADSFERARRAEVKSR